MTGEDEMRLAEGFQPQNYEDWRASVEKTLKGADFDRALKFNTYDNIQINPLYVRGDAPLSPLRPVTGRGVHSNRWDIRQTVTGPSLEEAVSQISEEVAGGATSVLLRLDACLRSGCTSSGNSASVGLDGAALHSVTSLKTVLEAFPQGVPVALDAGASALAVIKAVRDRDWAIGSSFGLDPIASTATAGLDPSSHDDWFTYAAQPVQDGITTLTASSLPYFDAGASEAQELGALIATGVAYLRALEARGLAVELSARRINFVLGLSQDQFITIAKVRAARALWSAVLKKIGVDPIEMRLEGVTASRMFTRHDPHVNVLRSTIAGFAGAVGGVDSITVLPFNTRMVGNNALARRVARNLQIVLAEESNLFRVADPAGGSFYIERLTDDLANAALIEFKSIEKAGGMTAALLNGIWADRVTSISKARDANVALRREAITGVSEFANIDDPPEKQLDLDHIVSSVKTDLQSNAALLSEPVCSGLGQFNIKPVAASYEALRDLSDAYLMRVGVRPTVFLANIGRLSDFNVRATFAANTFAAGGIAVAGVGDVGYESASAAAADFKVSEAKIVCICGSEVGYAEKAEDFARALKEQGASQIWLAGRPGDKLAAYSASGVDGYIYMGADILASLKMAHEAIGA
ncbi:MAG: methylmalonyl-CoA mutase family protein [Rhodospirillales bacterium]